jgi:hypothetical protein
MAGLGPRRDTCYRHPHASFPAKRLSNPRSRPQHHTSHKGKRGGSQAPPPKRSGGYQRSRQPVIRPKRQAGVTPSQQARTVTVHRARPAVPSRGTRRKARARNVSVPATEVGAAAATHSVAAPSMNVGWAPRPHPYRHRWKAGVTWQAGAGPETKRLPLLPRSRGTAQ